MTFSAPVILMLDDEKKYKEIKLSKREEFYCRCFVFFIKFGVWLVFGLAFYGLILQIPKGIFT